MSGGQGDDQDNGRKLSREASAMPIAVVLCPKQILINSEMYRSS